MDAPTKPRRLPRRTFLGGVAGVTGAAALAYALPRERPPSREGAPIAPLAGSRFRTIYADASARERFVRFLTNVFHLVPYATLDAVIAEGCRRYHTDRAIYAYVQERLPQVTPIFATLRYALPALAAQRREMAREAVALLEGRARPSSYVEIGSPGRYVASLREALGFGDEVYLVHDVEPGYGPVDVVERGGLAPAGAFLALDGYAPIDRAVIPAGGVDLVTCFIGLHHAPRDRVDAFVASIRNVLRPGGTFLLRDHDATSRDDDTFVALAHDVFNAGIEAPWSANAAELRFFQPVAATEALLARHGLVRVGERLAQPGDPTKNLLMAFERA